MDDIKKVLLETLREFHEFCEKNDLEYFLIGGTLLGAVRHKGFIPWDDDADVVMPRKDYNKLLELAGEFSHPFRMKSRVNDPNYNLPYAKLTNEKIIVEESSSPVILSGVWIDIFPLDVTFANPTLQALQFFLARRANSLIYLKKDRILVNDLSKKKRFALPYFKALSKMIPLDILLHVASIAESIPSKIQLNKVKHANLYGAWGKKEVASIESFYPKKIYSFEKLKFWGPKNPDLWLSNVYGDYMTPPPSEQRLTNHKLKIIHKEP